MPGITKVKHISGSLFLKNLRGDGRKAMQRLLSGETLDQADLADHRQLASLKVQDKTGLIGKTLHAAGV